MRAVKLTIPLTLACLLGVFGICIQYTAHPWASGVKETVALWSIVIGTITWVLSVYSLLRLHVGKVRKKEEGWAYSLFFFAGFALMVLAAAHNAGRWFWNPQVNEGSYYKWLHDALFVSAGATMFSMLGFFIASAAVRTFRARSFEATLLLVAAIIVMIGRVPIGEMISGYFPAVSGWLMQVPNTAARRGILLGVSVGTIAMSLRIIFGVERSYLGGGD